MARHDVPATATGRMFKIELRDVTDTAKFKGRTGLAYNTAGLVCWMIRDGDASDTQITLANVTTLGQYVPNGFKEVSAAHMAGVYEFHPPSSAYAVGAHTVFRFEGAADLEPYTLELVITQTNNQDSVRGGMTALPNAAANATNGLLTNASTSLNAIANAVLGFDFASVTSAASRSLLNAARFLRNKWWVASNTLHVTTENDTTEAWTGDVSRESAGTAGINGVDPS